MRSALARFAAAALAALTLAPPAVRAQDAAIEVAARPIERFDLRTPIGATYGRLVFLGGLELSSPAKAFGGLSGLRLSADGARFTAISDRGTWFCGRIAYEGSRPVGVADVVQAPILSPDGKPIAGRRGFDTEGLEISGRSAWVSSERTHQVLRFALDASGAAGPGRLVALPKEARQAPSNQGFEAIATTAGGALVMIAENFPDDAGHNRAYVVGAKSPFGFAVKRTENFSPTDLVRAPEGDFLLLERRFVPPFFLSVRIRRLPADDVRAGATVDGPVLMEASLVQTIDNFEAIAAHRGANGATVVSVLSDDNFASRQRTLLLQFELRE